MSQMLTYVVDSLQGADLNKVAEDTGINRWALVGIRRGGKYGTKNPGILTVEPLFHYFKKQEGRKLRRRAA